jgi:3-deoxy-manno-octulosonate cytidylyltransferase (CMP-KDO synthetase)
MTVVAIIPARYGSTRFPGKPLATIGNKPMVQHVYESASRPSCLDEVLVATDDRRIVEVVKGFGGKAVLTSGSHVSGTDRLAEVAKKIKAQWIINVQGDMPFFKPQTITRTLKALQRDRSILMGTARVPIFDRDEFLNPNVVKVVTDSEGFALYFSRAPIPYPRGAQREKWKGRSVLGYRHLGIYVYRRDFLIRFARLRPVPLEQAEGLEQLRALVHGVRIRVTDVDEDSVEVDTPEDLKRAEWYFTHSKGRH